MEKYELTREAIDYVCNHTDRFKDRERAKAICEMRLGGAKFEDIGREFNLSPSRCREICAKVSRIYAYDIRIGKVKPKEEIITLYDRIKAMPLDEMVSFFVYLNNNGDIIAKADRYICNKCKAEHGDHCPLVMMINASKLWLEGDGYGFI